MCQFSTWIKLVDLWSDMAGIGEGLWTGLNETMQAEQERSGVERNGPQSGKDEDKRGEVGDIGWWFSE